MHRLAAAGRSVRGIAAEVFGDARFRGRVERILATPVALPPLARREDDFEGLSELEALELLFERRMDFLKRKADPPSMTELRYMLDVHRRLESLRTLARLRARRSNA